jgi:hypothetical protein
MHVKALLVAVFAAMAMATAVDPAGHPGLALRHEGHDEHEGHGSGNSTTEDHGDHSSHSAAPSSTPSSTAAPVATGGVVSLQPGLVGVLAAAGLVAVAL